MAIAAWPAQSVRSFDQLDADTQRLFLAVGLTELATFGLWTAAALLDTDSADPGDSFPRAGSSLWPCRQGLRDATGSTISPGLCEPAGGAEGNPISATKRQLSACTRHCLLSFAGHIAISMAVPSRSYTARCLTGTRRREVLAEVDQAPMAWYEADRRNLRAVSNTVVGSGSPKSAGTSLSRHTSLPCVAI